MGTTGTEPLLEVKIEQPRAWGLRRSRLDRRLDTVWDRGLAVVAGAAGSGKSTLLAQFAERSDRPVAWYRADATDASASLLLRYLRCSIERSLGREMDDGGAGPEQLAATVSTVCGDSGLALVVDDVHNLQSSAAGDALDRFIACTPRNVRVVLAGRHVTGVELSRRRVSGELVELGSDDLRFRTWEVEQLFRDVYREFLRPEELAALSRRLDGWAAGLRLFHLATAGRSPDSRRAILASIGVRNDLYCDYLTENILRSLPDDDHEFLVRTSVLGRLSGELCDEFLGISGCAAVLARMEHSQVFTLARDGAEAYRYHEVLRTHLESSLLDELGDEAIRWEYLRAAELLERHGWPSEAVRAYCRGGDLEAAAQLLHRRGEDLVGSVDSWWEAIPPALLEQDPWVLLARARRALVAGDATDAIELYRCAEHQAGDRAPAATCRRERRAAEEWSTRPLQPGTGWTGAMRSAVQRSPGSPRGAGGPAALGGEAFASAFGLLLAGRATEAAGAFDDIAGDAGSSEALTLAARVAAGFGSLLMNRVDADSMALLAQEAELRHHEHLARIATALAVAGNPVDAPYEVPRWPGTVSERWVAVAALCVAGLRRPSERAALSVLSSRLERATTWLVEIDARTLASWTGALRAACLVELGDPTAVDEAAAADGFARGCGAPGARVIAIGAILASQQRLDPELRRLLDELSQECGVACDVLAPGVAQDDERTRGRGTSGAPEQLSLRCLGPLEVRLGGSPVDIGPLRPKSRSVLRFLAVHGGAPVHREVIVEAIWPESDPASGTHNLQVAVSSLRRLLEPGTARGESSYIERHDDSYRLAEGSTVVVDLWSLRAELADGHRLFARNDPLGAAETLSASIPRTAIELCPEEGPSDWLVAARSDLHRSIADASMLLAELYAQRGATELVADACERGLLVDPFRDGLWRLLVRSLEQSGAAAEAARARRSYRQLLDELGLAGESSLLREELDLSDRGARSLR